MFFTFNVAMMSSWIRDFENVLMIWEVRNIPLVHEMNEMNITQESPELSWTRWESIGIYTRRVTGKFGGSSMFRNGSGAMFGLRVVEIMETFETN